MPTIIQAFISYFENLADNKDYDLSKLYTDDIAFQAPIHQIEGLENLNA